MQNGYELEITRKVADAVSVPVIASGGAGTVDHIIDAFEKGHADAALIASMVLLDGYTCYGIKAELAQRTTLPLRLTH